MPLSERYRHQVALLIETCHSLRRKRILLSKAGLRSICSVDIDLTYLPACRRAAGIAGRD